MNTIRVSVRQALNEYREEARKSGADLDLLKFYKDNDTVEFRTETVEVQVVG